MRILQAIFICCKRLFWAMAVAYMVAWHNVYKEEDNILYQVVTTIEEDEADENSSPDTMEMPEITNATDEVENQS